MSSITDKLTASLADFAKVKTNDKISSASLAAGKQLVRDARAELEAPPAPVPLPPPPVVLPPPSTVDLRPWMTPIETDAIFGSASKSTSIKTNTVLEHTLLQGMIRIEGGAEVKLDFCRSLGPSGAGDTGTLIYLLDGHLITDHCEITGSEGHSGIYQHGGIWTPIETWIHDNGVNRGPEFQQAYIGAGRIEGGKGGLIEAGSDYALQFYNAAAGIDRVDGCDWDGLKGRGCKHGLVVLSHRVNNVRLTNFVGDGTGCEYGVRAYNLEGTGNVVTGHAWGAGRNIAGGPGLDTSGLIQAAP